ncbi:MAG TPA: penicillin-binding protein, partial [Xanthobacteraceae bacterium]
GYTANLVTGVWLGNDDNSPTRKTTGGGLPVEIWSRFMKVAHQGVPPQPLPGLMAPAAPVAPPAAVVAAAPGAMPTGSSRPVAAEPVSLDQWLLEKVFGRR